MNDDADSFFQLPRDPCQWLLIEHVPKNIPDKYLWRLLISSSGSEIAGRKILRPCEKEGEKTVLLFYHSVRDANFALVNFNGQFRSTPFRVYRVSDILQFIDRQETLGFTGSFYDISRTVCYSCEGNAVDCYRLFSSFGPMTVAWNTSVPCFLYQRLSNAIAAVWALDNYANNGSRITAKKLGPANCMTFSFSRLVHVMRHTGILPREDALESFLEWTEHIFPRSLTNIAKPVCVRHSPLDGRNGIAASPAASCSRASEEHETETVFDISDSESTGRQSPDQFEQESHTSEQSCEVIDDIADEYPEQPFSADEYPEQPFSADENPEQPSSADENPEQPSSADVNRSQTAIRSTEENPSSGPSRDNRKRSRLSVGKPAQRKKKCLRRKGGKSKGIWSRLRQLPCRAAAAAQAKMERRKNIKI